MTPVHTVITKLLAGEQIPAHDSEEMQDVLQSMRETVRDQAAQRTLGMFVLSAISEHLKSGLHTAKVMQRARLTDSEGGEDE